MPLFTLPFERLVLVIGFVDFGNIASVLCVNRYLSQAAQAALFPSVSGPFFIGVNVHLELLSNVTLYDGLTPDDVSDPSPPSLET